ncbi:hypothetical protein QCA50_009027 [Cerrena zonata]|uniref:PEBP-like protein n=1 Tax=Cerrena zonata TaxID=2478898 RepID=A0AAW0G392_9APHY
MAAYLLISIFILELTDPPAPQDTSLPQIGHSLGGNYFPSKTGELTNTTATISEFLQPGPPDGSEPHRYIFLLFHQSRDFFNQTLVNSTTSIANFDIS